MSQKEFPGIVENASIRSNEAATVVHEAVRPLVEFALDMAVLKIVRASRGHARLSQFILPIIGRKYAEAAERQAKRVSGMIFTA